MLSVVALVASAWLAVPPDTCPAPAPPTPTATIPVVGRPTHVRPWVPKTPPPERK